ncbi:MAG TPA: histidine triad nucleotide-binding protein [Chloroflexota bacterium]|nr:histidine triad nucleotide-binding protein [Chloroflexota bacterium]
MDQQCVFCRIIAGDIPSTRVLETDQALALRDLNPQAPAHILVLPREHVPGFGDLPAESPTWNALLAAVQQVVQQEGLTDGFRLVINSGDRGGQTVPHLHIHVLGGRQMRWPPG